MRLNKATGQMSKFLTHTWHVMEGCEHACIYCWAEQFARRRGRDMEPRLIEAQLEGTIRRNGLMIGTSWTGDMWGEYVPRAWIEMVVDKIKTLPENTFVPLTKNPARYLEYKHRFPGNIILGVTIESNRHYPAISDAPPPDERFEAMRELNFPKLIIIEPIMKFDVDILVQWIREIHPVAVEIGADSGNNRLPEPSGKKIHQLIERLRHMGLNVLLKPNLTRLYDPRKSTLDALFTKPVTKPVTKEVEEDDEGQPPEEQERKTEADPGTKPKYYLGSNAAFWMEPAELKALRAKYEVVLT